MSLYSYWLSGVHPSLNSDQIDVVCIFTLGPVVLKIGLNCIVLKLLKMINSYSFDFTINFS